MDAGGLSGHLRSFTPDKEPLLMCTNPIWGCQEIGCQPTKFKVNQQERDFGQQPISVYLNMLGNPSHLMV